MKQQVKQNQKKTTKTQKKRMNLGYNSLWKLRE